MKEEIVYSHDNIWQLQTNGIAKEEQQLLIEMKHEHDAQID